MGGFAVGTGAAVFGIVAVILILKWKWRDGEKPTVGEIYGNVGPFVASSLALLQLLATAAAQTQGDLPAWLRQFYSLLKMVLVQTPGTNPQCMEDENANPFIMDMVIMSNALVVLTLCVLFMSHPFRVETHLRRCWLASREYGRCWLCKCVVRRGCKCCAEEYEHKFDPYCDRCKKEVVVVEKVDPYALDMSLYGGAAGGDAESDGLDGAIRSAAERVFTLGAEVEARFQGGEGWYGAVIIFVHKDNTYDVIYEDGDGDEQIPPTWIRLPPRVEISRENPHRALVAEPLQIRDGAETGDVIEGTVLGALASDSESVLEEHIYVEGDVVDAKYLGGADWFRATIVAVNTMSDGELNSFRVRYAEDGEEEDGVASTLLRFVRTAASGDSGAESAVGIGAHVDDIVVKSTNPLRESPASSARLTRAEKRAAAVAKKRKRAAEKRVAKAAAKKAKVALKKAKKDAALAVQASPAVDATVHHTADPATLPFRVGEVVETRFSGGADWYGSRITRANAAHTLFAIEFDDGDCEDDVPIHCIRRVPVCGGAEASGSSSNSSSSSGSGSGSSSGSGSDSDSDSDDEAFELVGPDTLFAGDLVEHVDASGVRRRATILKSQVLYIGKDIHITYDAAYDDGGEEAWELTRDALTRVELPFKCTEGGEVEANFKGKGTWFRAVIDYVHEDEQYDVDYDDGEFEGKVPLERIRRRARYGVADLPAITKIQAIARGQAGRLIYEKMCLDQGAKAKMARLRRKSFAVASEVAGQISENLPGPLEMLAPVFIAAQGVFDAAGQEREEDDEPFIVNLFEEIITPGIRMLLCAIPMMEYSTITQKCLDTLHCVESPEHGLVLAAQAKPIRCWEGIHIVPAMIAGVVIVIYGIGFRASCTRQNQSGNSVTDYRWH